MTTIRTRPYPDGGAAVTGRAATMPPVTGPGRPGQASRTRLQLAVASAGGLLAAGMIVLAAWRPRAPRRTAPCTASRLGAARPGTATTLTSGATPSTAGGVVTYAATVRPAPGGGTVAFTDGTTRVPGCGAQPVDNAGTATCQVAYPGAGAHAITAAYSGDARHAASTSAALAQQVAYRMQMLGNPAASGTSGPAVSVRVVLLDAAGADNVRAGNHGHGHRCVAQPVPGHRAAQHPHRREPRPVALLPATHHRHCRRTRQAATRCRSPLAATRLHTRPSSSCRDLPGRAQTRRRHDGTVPTGIGQPQHRGGPSRRPGGSGNLPPTISYLGTRRHSQPTQPRGRHGR